MANNKEWRKLKAELPEEGIRDWDYEEKIDRHMDLELFRALESVYVPQKKVPPLRKLSDLIRQKRSPDNQKRLTRRMEIAWQEASEDLELRSTRKLPPRLRNWEDEESFPLGHTQTAAAVILGIDRKTLYNWIKAKTKNIHPSDGRIPISEIKRLRKPNPPVIE